MGGGVNALPWSWKECTLLPVYEAYEFCLTLREPRSVKSAERPPEGRFEGIEKVFAVVGLGGAAQPQPPRRSMFLREPEWRAGAVRQMDMETNRKAEPEPHPLRLCELVRVDE
jgi:hypothetical protein